MSVKGRLVVTLFFAKLLPGVMGPGFRQDDGESAATACPTYAGTFGSGTTFGPVTSGRLTR
jgi:hypothetical protein